ncbi:MAG: hypothetical protein U1E67_04800 [Hyphomicrobiales bacterium]
MFYVEFIHWDRSVPIEIFRFLGQQSSGWKENSPDRIVLQLGRTLRFGPQPGYLAIWEIPNIGRLDEWETYFHSADSMINRRSQAMHRAITIERAGLFNALIIGDLKSYPLYYLEFYKPFAPSRAADFPRNALVYLLNRVGFLGPDFEAIAIWGCHTYADVEALTCRRSPGVPDAADAGVYRKFGEEVI